MKISIGHILIGWGKKLGFIQTSLAEQKLSALRIEKCQSCDIAKESKFLALVEGEEPQYKKHLVCTGCGGCPCIQKSLVVDEACPLHKW